MGMRLHLVTLGFGAGVWLALCVLPACEARGQGVKEQDQGGTTYERSHPDRVPQRPSEAPAFSVPVESLGFSPPASFYLGQRFCLASLDFLDENRLLFTFRVPGLIHRQPRSGNEDDGEERHIKALVIALPAGTVEAEAVWALHDRWRYLWMLKDGRFLLRDRDELRLGDATLELKPYLRFPGPVQGVEMDPSQQLLVTNSREPVYTAPKAGDVPRPASAAADVDADHDPQKAEGPPPNLVLRILRRDTGKVMLVSRVRSEVHLPINADGYLELLPGRNADWVVNLNSFGGGSAKLGEVDSTCSPTYDFVSQREFLITTCTRQDLRSMVAMNIDGRRLWEDLPSSSPVWPLYITGADGSRLARESLAVSHPVTAFSPLSFDDVKGQLVEVFDSATGKITLTAPVSPVYDAGGNVAISPSGRRVAVLDAGAIQVFELPAPATPPAPGQIQASKSSP
jgi:hypothetical protein